MYVLLLFWNYNLIFFLIYGIFTFYYVNFKISASKLWAVVDGTDKWLEEDITLTLEKDFYTMVLFFFFFTKPVFWDLIFSVLFLKLFTVFLNIWVLYAYILLPLWRLIFLFWNPSARSSSLFKEILEDKLLSLLSPKMGNLLSYSLISLCFFIKDPFFFCDIENMKV